MPVFDRPSCLRGRLSGGGAEGATYPLFAQKRKTGETAACCSGYIPVSPAYEGKTIPRRGKGAGRALPCALTPPRHPRPGSPHCRKNSRLWCVLCPAPGVSGFDTSAGGNPERSANTSQQLATWRNTAGAAALAVIVAAPGLSPCGYGETGKDAPGKAASGDGMFSAQRLQDSAARPEHAHQA